MVYFKGYCKTAKYFFTFKSYLKPLDIRFSMYIVEYKTFSRVSADRFACAMTTSLKYQFGSLCFL